jgi:hypothetical protein
LRSAGGADKARWRTESLTPMEFAALAFIIVFVVIAALNRYEFGRFD